MYDNPINREYVRTDYWSVIAQISKEDDTEQWVDVQVPNIAAGGLLFLTDIAFELGDVLWFDLQIDPIMPGISGKIHMRVKGEIKGDRGMDKGLRSLSVAFTEISKSDRIRLDELVRMTNFKYKLDSDSGPIDR
jgi:hypothetical protein